MKERPKCYTKDCNNPGWVLLSGQFYCGECVAKLVKKRNEEATKEISEILEND